MCIYQLFTSPLYVALGASFGFILTIVKLYEYFTKGAKIDAQVTRSIYKNNPTVNTSIENNLQITRYTASTLVTMQIINCGTESTSIISTFLISPEKIQNKSKITGTKNIKFSDNSLTMTCLVDDNRTIIVKPGEAITEFFEFEIEVSEADYLNESSFNLLIQFVRHKDLYLSTTFKPTIK